VRDQVLYPYKTTGKIIVLYILIFLFLDKFTISHCIYQLPILIQSNLLVGLRHGSFLETDDIFVSIQVSLCMLHDSPLSVFFI
jgi:hypothetical protein